jgi:hypothetical protein
MKQTKIYIVAFALLLTIFSITIGDGQPRWIAVAVNAVVPAEPVAVVAVVPSPVGVPSNNWPTNCYKQDAQDRRLAACQALQNAGFNKEKMQIMLAIMQGESGLRLDAVGDQSLANAKWSSSRGPAQIRSLRSEYGKGTCRDEQALINNGWDFHAKCAYEISGQASNFKPWSVFLHKIYLKYM